jgi:Rieske Fe-S protein
MARRFLVMAVLLQGCATFGYVTQEEVAPPEAYTITDEGGIIVNLTRIPALQPVGGAATIEDEALPRNIIIAHPEEGVFVVASSHCTHRSKALAYDPEEKVFVCSALGSSRFSLTGEVLGGPAGRPLEIYPSILEGDLLMIEMPPP